MNTYVFHIDSVEEYSELKVVAPSKSEAEKLLTTAMLGGQPLVVANQWKLVHQPKENN